MSFIDFILLFAVEIRKSLHLRMGLPFDRPLLRIANAMNFCTGDGGRSESIRKGNLIHCCSQRVTSLSQLTGYNVIVKSASTLLKDVHMGIPGSGGM